MRWILRRDWRRSLRELLFETDWLATNPVFYNEKTGKTSRNVNEVIDYSNLEFDEDGFNEYLDFGYSVFERTPVKHVMFLRHSSKLWREEDGKLSVEYLDDPVETWKNPGYSETDIWDLVHRMVGKWEAEQEGEIMLPLSGGFDSRILLMHLKDRDRIRAFTFGTSYPQRETYEVVHAEYLAKKFNIKWEFVEIGDFHRDLTTWFDRYGISVHAHGMYQVEFYRKVAGMMPPTSPPLASGIIGDAWSGGKALYPIRTVKDIIQLGITHGMHADPGQSLVKKSGAAREAYYTTFRERLAIQTFAEAERMRFKMTLISYLLRVPELFGFRTWSPYIDLELAMAMAHLPLERRAGRKWQVEYLAKQNLHLESMKLGGRVINTMSREGMRRVPLEPLDEEILRPYIKRDYIARINRSLAERPALAWWLDYVYMVPKIGGLLRLMGAPRSDPLNIPYAVYITLKPIEMLLRRAGQSNPRVG